MRTAAGVALLLALYPIQSGAQERAPKPDDCPNIAELTGNQYLDLSPIGAGGSTEREQVACTILPRAQYDPRSVDLQTASGVRLGIGRSGQIYSIRVPGISEDLIPSQRADAFYVDEVFQTAASNVAIRRASPRGQAISPEQRREPSWHYHQAGAYQRGPLRDRAPVFSPLLFNRIDTTAGTYETLNLAIQAHVENRQYTPDRFLVYSRVRDTGRDAFQITQAWINNSKVPNAATGDRTTSLDYFNFPWVVLRNRAVPYVIAGVDRSVVDLSDRAWPPAPQDTVNGARWIAAFNGPGPDAKGLLITLAADGRTRLRVGSTEKKVVTNVASDRTAFQFERQRIYVIGAVRTSEVVRRGEAVVGQYYLAFGTRAQLLERAEELVTRSSIRKEALPAAKSAADLIGYCHDAAAHYTACPAGSRPKLALSRKICSGCLPLYEIADRRQGRVVYSTTPYLDLNPDAHLVNQRYTVLRILGWLVGQPSRLPEVATIPLARGNSEGIEADPSDVGSAHYFKY